MVKFDTYRSSCCPLGFTYCRTRKGKSFVWFRVFSRVLELRWW